MRKQPKFWNNNGLWSFLLSPLSVLYGMGVTLDRMFTPPHRVSVPVIGIGNVTVGGAGKTPTTIALAQLLQQRGMKPHILSRGYGAHMTSPLRVDRTQHTAKDVGDEALLLAQHAPTWVFPDRHTSGVAAIAEGADVLICDDALQHYALKKDVSILVIDGGYGIGNGLLLPAGPLREPFTSALKRCDAIVLIGDDKHELCKDISTPVFKATIVPAADMSWIKNTRVVAFAGIARPQKFYQTLLELGTVITATYDFPDHHVFSESELEMLATGGTMVTTEKDWMRLPPTWQARVKYVPIALHFSASNRLSEWMDDALTT